MTEAALALFGTRYAEHRAAEGRGYAGEELLSLPYLSSGAFADQWGVRARSFDAFVARVLRPQAKRLGRPLKILDLGAGNCWLSYRVALDGHQAIALDIRDDAVDGLGAAEPLVQQVPGQIERILASFDAIPLGNDTVDIAVFNASLHYALDLRRVLDEALRTVRPDGRLVILDSPFYRDERDGAAMVVAKQAGAESQFAERAEALLALPFVEYLTAERLNNACHAMHWQRHRVLYPLWYELRPWWAMLRGRRRPSRFDLWVGQRR